MSADGVWNIVVKSPMGDQPSTMTFKVEGGVLTGMATAGGATNPVANGKVDGDTLTWSNTITSPFPMTLDFTGTLAGDTLNGSVKAGSFGSFPFTGARG
jgi:hypothetical protein